MTRRRGIVLRRALRQEEPGQLGLAVRVGLVEDALERGAHGRQADAEALGHVPQPLGVEQGQRRARLGGREAVALAQPLGRGRAAARGVDGEDERAGARRAEPGALVVQRHDGQQVGPRPRRARDGDAADRAVGLGRHGDELAQPAVGGPVGAGEAVALAGEAVRRPEHLRPRLAGEADVQGRVDEEDAYVQTVDHGDSQRFAAKRHGSAAPILASSPRVDPAIATNNYEATSSDRTQLAAGIRIFP